MKIFKGVIFYPEIPIGCTSCHKPTGLVMTKDYGLLCQLCYRSEELADCLICTGMPVLLPIYWVCGHHYESRLTDCSLSLPEEVDLHRMEAAFHKTKLKIDIDLSFDEFIKDVEYVRKEIAKITQALENKV